MLASAFNTSLTTAPPEPARAPRTSTITVQVSVEEAARIAHMSAYERRAALLRIPEISPAEGEEGVINATAAVKVERDRRNARRASLRRARMMSGNLSADGEETIVGRKPTSSRDTPRDISICVGVDEIEHRAVTARASALRLSTSDLARRLLLNLDLASPEPHQSADAVLAVSLAVARLSRGGFALADMGEEAAA